jgi:hypothetical protein
LTNPTITPTGFPDLFVFSLLSAFQSHVTGIEGFFSRPIRPDDPNPTIAVIESDAEPKEYEIAGQMDPSLLEWEVVVQTYNKAANEIEGRNVRRRLLRDCRKTLFLPTTVTALMTLVDDTERVASFRLRRLQFSGAEARDANKQFFFLGQIVLTFQTERL